MVYGFVEERSKVEYKMGKENCSPKSQGLDLSPDSIGYYVRRFKRVIDLPSPLAFLFIKWAHRHLPYHHAGLDWEDPMLKDKEKCPFENHTCITHFITFCRSHGSLGGASSVLAGVGVRIRVVYLDFFSTERASSTDTSRDLLPLLKMLEGNLVGEATQVENTQHTACCATGLGGPDHTVWLKELVYWGSETRASQGEGRLSPSHACAEGFLGQDTWSCWERPFRLLFLWGQCQSKLPPGRTE